MTLKFNLLWKKPQKDAAPTATLDCPHWELAPCWDSAADMGHSDLISHYICVTCGQRLSRREADARAS